MLRRVDEEASQIFSRPWKEALSLQGRVGNWVEAQASREVLGHPLTIIIILSIIPTISSLGFRIISSSPNGRGVGGAASCSGPPRLRLSPPHRILISSSSRNSRIPRIRPNHHHPHPHHLLLLLSCLQLPTMIHRMPSSESGVSQGRSLSAVLPGAGAEVAVNSSSSSSVVCISESSVRRILTVRQQQEEGEGQKESSNHHSLRRGAMSILSTRGEG